MNDDITAKWEALSKKFPPMPTTDKKPHHKKAPESPELTEGETSKKQQTCYYQVCNSEVQTYLDTIPEPFQEPPETPYANDPADFIVPKTLSFLTDFVSLGRGTESPTLFMIWSGLWLLSATLNRNAGLDWYPKVLWPNLYVVLVSPAGLCRKSTGLDFGQDLLEKSSEYRRDNLDAYKNEYRFITSRSSPSGVYMMLRPDSKVFIDGANLMSARRTSKVTLVLQEMATFLSKQQYMTGLVNDITNLFDCRDHDSDITRERGFEPLENIYITLIGAITPTGLEESIPREALSGGLLSRMVLVYQELPTKIYSRPLHLTGFPTVESLAPKLAWIADHARGTYKFTPEAEAAYEAWYVDWKTRIIAGELTLREDEHRFDTLLRKVAMLLRVAEYRPGTEITLQNFTEAKAIMDYTQSMASRLMVTLGNTDFVSKLTKIKDYLVKKGTCTRRQLLNRYASAIPSAEITTYVNQLIDQGYISVTFNGQPLWHSAGRQQEVYKVEPFNETIQP